MINSESRAARDNRQCGFRCNLPSRSVLGFLKLVTLNMVTLRDFLCSEFVKWEVEGRFVCRQLTLCEATASRARRTFASATALVASSSLGTAQTQDGLDRNREEGTRKHPPPQRLPVSIGCGNQLRGHMSLRSCPQELVHTGRIHYLSNVKCLKCDRYRWLKIVCCI